jgi:RHS repeat-associated protein
MPRASSNRRNSETGRVAVFANQKTGRSVILLATGKTGHGIFNFGRRCRSALAESISPCKTRRFCAGAITNLPVRSQCTQQYSISALTNSGGTIVERYAYSAYGEPTITDGGGTLRSSTAEGNRYTYTGREWDKDVELYHYRARWYDALSGRFCSRDPAGYVDGMSLYRGYFVPDGLDPFGEKNIPIGEACIRITVVEEKPCGTRVLTQPCRIRFLICRYVTTQTLKRSFRLDKPARPIIGQEISPIRTTRSPLTPVRSITIPLDEQHCGSCALEFGDVSPLPQPPAPALVGRIVRGIPCSQHRM